MDIVLQFAAILLGVVISIVLPIVIKWMILPNKASGFVNYVNTVLMPYIKAGIAAIVVSFVILILAPETDTFTSAAMLGLGWQSFIKNILPA
jgi:hypothetical protein